MESFDNRFTSQVHFNLMLYTVIKMHILKFAMQSCEFESRSRRDVLHTTLCDD